MKKYFDSVRESLFSELSKGARGYLKVGLSLFQEHRHSYYANIQPIIGNLGIAIELMLKASIVRHNPLLIFRGLPLELQVLFSCPDALPEDFNWRPFDIEIRTCNYNSAELNDCIAVFYLLFSKQKQTLKPYFRFLSTIRNASVHSSIPSFQKYEVERIVYLALLLNKILNEAKVFEFYGLTEKDTNFFENYTAERGERVKTKIEQAKIKSKEIKHLYTSVRTDSWELYTTHCPVCKSHGLLFGTTDINVEVQTDRHGEIEAEAMLDFFADSFECEYCGLKLGDSEELHLAGIDTHYDRTDELDHWYMENGAYGDE